MSMHHPLADAYPRRWKGYNQCCRPCITHDWSSLQSLIIRQGVMTNVGTRPAIIRGKVISALPVRRAFTIAEIVGITGLKYEAVGSIVSMLVSDGYPVSRVGKRYPAKYWYEGGR